LSDASISNRWRPLGWAIGNGDCDGMIQHHHRIIGDLQQQLIERLDLRPVGFLSVWGLVVDCAIAAWSWYGPVVLRGNALVIKATLSAILSTSQSVQSCSASGTSSPLAVSGRGGAWVGSISASSPACSPSSGSSW